MRLVISRSHYLAVLGFIGRASVNTLAGKKMSLISSVTSPSRTGKGAFLRIENYILVVFSIAAVAICYGTKLWGLDKTFISSDEGWYMYLQVNQVTDCVSRSHMLFRWLPFASDAFFNRLTCLALLLVGSLIFTFGFTQWLKQKLDIHVSFIIVFGLLSLCTLNPISCPSLNYTQLIHITTVTSLGLLFLGFTRSKSVFFFLSGLVLSMLFPIKITSLSITPFILASLVIMMPNWRKGLLSWCFGFLAGLCVYIFIIESPSAVAHWVTLGSGVANEETGDYGFKSLIMWVLRTISYYFRWVLLSYIILWMPSTLKQVKYLQKHSFLRYVLLGIFIVLICGFFWRNVHPMVSPHTRTYMLTGAVWVVSMIITALCFKRNPRRDFAAIVLLLLTPACISFGTNVIFTINHSPRYVCVILALAYLLPERLRKVMLAVIICIFMASIVNFAYPPGGVMKNWHSDVYSQQTQALSSIGINQNIKIDDAYIDRIRFYQQNVPANTLSQCSQENWGVVTLLDLKVIDPAFRFPNSETNYTQICDVLDNGIPISLLYDKTTGYGDTYTETWAPLLARLEKDEYNLDTKVWEEYCLTVVTKTLNPKPED